MHSAFATISAALIAVGAVGEGREANAAARNACEAAKLLATAKAVRSVLVCYGHAARKGAPVDADCIAAPLTTLTTAYNKADTKGTCSTEGDGASAAGRVQIFARDVVAALRAAPTASRCDAKLLKATATKAKRILLARARGLKRLDSEQFSASAMKIVTDFTDAFNSAREQADCTGSVSESTVEEIVDRFTGLVGQLTGRLQITSTLNVVKRLRSEVLASRVALEDAGWVVAPDGSKLSKTAKGAAHWLLNVGGASVVTNADGTFSADVPASSGTKVKVYYPGDRANPLVTLSLAEFLAGEGVVRLELPMRDTCGMTPEDHCTDSAGRAARLVTTGALRCDPTLGDCPQGGESSCLDYNGPFGTKVDIDPTIDPLGALRNFILSTCHEKVLEGCCDLEADDIRVIVGDLLGKPIEHKKISCVENHKGRFCQEVTKGDVAVRTPAGQASTLDCGPSSVEFMVSANDTASLTLHNNACYGQTYVQQVRSDVGGVLSGPIDSLGLIDHFASATQYLGDLDLAYHAPSMCPPDAQARDEFTFGADGLSVSIRVACAALCGNGAVEAGEECDDGNADPNDGCDQCARTDNDNDGVPDSVDNDDDNDGIPDTSDPLPRDHDNDGVSDPVDPDDDNDEIPDGEDRFPLDHDNDGIPDDVDPDDDNDGIPDDMDPDPFDPTSPGDDWGDPHLVTFDRLAYDFQGVGEFILARSVDDRLAVQARMSPWGGSRVVSITSAAAMNVSGDRVAIYVGGSSALYVNGIPTNPALDIVSLPQGGQIEPRQGGAYSITWPDGSQVHVTLMGAYLNLRLQLPRARRARMEGLLGNFDADRRNEFVTRDGVTLSPPLSFDQLYKQYGESWRISQDESLFDYLEGESTDTYTDRTFPGGFVSTVVLSDSARTQAEQVCRDAGVTDPVLFDACVLDVGLTADRSFAASAASVGSPQGSVGADSALGRVIDNPARSCLDIHQFGVAGADGKYWIQLPSGVFQMHCDFSSGGGGWTRVGALDTSTGYCGNNALADLRIDPDASMAKVPGANAQALITGTPSSPAELMYFSRADGRYVWHALQSPADFDTSSKHTSSSFYCSNWHCDDGTIDASACGSEGQGCPVTAHGIGGFRKKIYVDSDFARHIRGMHVNGNMCRLPNYERASIWIYVR